MKISSIRTIVAGLAVLAVAAAATAQSAPGILHTLDVQRLAATDDPGDHIRLSAHFAALAKEFGEDVTRYEARAKAPFGNPNRWSSTDPGARWTRLAARAADTARTVNELAWHHARLASGMASAAPAGSGRFYGGDGAREPTALELRQIAAAARTPSDHLVLEEYYLGVADRETKTADKHVAMAQGFRGAPRRTGTGDAGVHCDRIVTQARDAAGDALARALTHRQLAYIQ